MRELKFRAWDRDVKALVYPNDKREVMDFHTGIKNPSPYERYEILKFFDVVMQYTGLKDKNGKEIYEGDLVLDYSWLYPNKEDACVVRWDEERCGFVPFNYYNSKLEVYEAQESSYNYEVIGNIYENPELLDE